MRDSPQLTLLDKLSHCTVRIECDYADGTKGTGTGFFYQTNDYEGFQTPVIITNKHVVRNAWKGRFQLTIKTANETPDYGKNSRFELNNFESQWTPHPAENIDLCAMPIAPLLEMCESRGESFFYFPLNDDLIPEERDISEFTGMEEIAMIGYPNGLWDQINNLPIFRRGTIASIYQKDWNGRPEFLIDAACFPGSSGSPVLQINTRHYLAPHLNIGENNVQFRLLGVLYAGTQHTVEGKVKVVNVPKVRNTYSVSEIPNNLGIVTKSNNIRIFETLFSEKQLKTNL